MEAGPTYTTTIDRQVRPAGADQHVAAFRHAAASIRELRELLRVEFARLDQVWVGHSHDSFLAECQGLDPMCDALAERLMNMAQRINTKTVTVRETIEVGRPGVQ